MKITECTYCGMTAITDQNVCASCQAFVSPDPETVAENQFQAEAVAQPEINPFQPEAPPTEPAYPVPNSQYVPQPNFQNNPPPTFQERRSFPNSGQTFQALESNCVKCGAPLPRGQRACLDCGKSKKSSPVKYIVILLIFGAIGFFGFDYVYEQVSPHGTFRKYSKTTGADDSIVYENFVLKGDTVVSVDAPPSFTLRGGINDQHSMETYTFKMVYKKPNLSSIELLRGTETAFKQVFDGARGWKYTNMPGQPAGYQDTEDGFGSKKMGLGMDEFDSLEFMNEATAQEFGVNTIKYLKDIKEIEVADLKQPSGEKTFIVGKQKRNGKTESTLLVFDQQSGLLLGMVKNATMGNLLVTSRIYFNKYAKFPVKKKGLFGIGEARILVPTEMKFVTSAENSAQAGGMPVIMIQMNVKTVETDAAIDAGYFTK